MKATSFACTFSCGIAQLTARLTGQTLIKLADEPLYKAKHQGRNQIVSG